MGIIKDPTSWRTGFELGLAGFSFPYSKPRRKPTAYLYNGIRLPALPEWDKETYPYVSVVVGTTYTYLVLSEAVEIVTATGAIEDGTGRYCFRLEDTLWGELNFYLKISGDVVWSNGNVYTDSGELYLAASDPVPIYE